MPTPLAKRSWQRPDTTAHRSATAVQKKRIDRMGCSPAGNGADLPGRVSIVGDCVLPIQFYEARQRSPEEELLRAILFHAYNDLVHYGARMHQGTARRLYADAWAWFANDDELWLYSFVSICAALGLNPAAIREGLSRHFTAEGKRPGSPSTSIYLGKQKELRTGAQIDEFMESRQGKKAA